MTRSRYNIKQRRERMDRAYAIKVLVDAGLNKSEVARVLGVSRQRVDQLLRGEKHIARFTLTGAIKRGEVHRPSRCEQCKDTGFTEGHHEDYGEPLKVTWLCIACHKALHRQNRK